MNQTKENEWHSLEQYIIRNAAEAVPSEQLQALAKFCKKLAGRWSLSKPDLINWTAVKDFLKCEWFIKKLLGHDSYQFDKSHYQDELKDTLKFLPVSLSEATPHLWMGQYKEFIITSCWDFLKSHEPKYQDNEINRPMLCPMYKESYEFYPELTPGYFQKMDGSEYHGQAANDIFIQRLQYLIDINASQTLDQQLPIVKKISYSYEEIWGSFSEDKLNNNEKLNIAVTNLRNLTYDTIYEYLKSYCYAMLMGHKCHIKNYHSMLKILLQTVPLIAFFKYTEGRNMIHILTLTA